MSELWFVLSMMTLILGAFACGFVCASIISATKTDGVLWVEQVDETFINTRIEIRMPPEKLLTSEVFVLQIKQK